MQNNGRFGEHLVNLVPPGGENLNYRAGDQNEAESSSAVPAQPVHVEGDAQDYI
jgi:hypothetical protein